MIFSSRIPFSHVWFELPPLHSYLRKFGVVSKVNRKTGLFQNLKKGRPFWAKRPELLRVRYGAGLELCACNRLSQKTIRPLATTIRLVFFRSPTTSEDFQPVLDQMAMRTLDFARADWQPSRDGTLGVKLIHAVRMEKPFSFLMR